LSGQYNEQLRDILLDTYGTMIYSNLSLINIHLMPYILSMLLNSMHIVTSSFSLAFCLSAMSTTKYYQITTQVSFFSNIPRKFFLLIFSKLSLDPDSSL